MSVISNMRILHVINDLGVGGAQRLLVSVLQNINVHQYECYVLNLNFITHNDLEAEIRALGIPVANYKAIKIGDPFCIPFIIKYIKQNKIDVVHTHLNIASFYGTIAAKLAGVSKIISTEHNTSSFVTRKIYQITARCYLQWNDGIVAISNAVKKSIVDLLPKVEKKITVIHNGVDTDLFTSKIPKAFDSDLIRIGTLARQDPRKGIAVLNACAKTISKQNNKIKFYNAGTASSDFSHIIYVNLDGTQKSVRDYLDSLHIFVLPSLEEGFGLVALEAMAMGLPVIASAVGGLVEIIHDGQNGLLVPPANPDALANSIQTILSNDKLRFKIIQNGRKFVQDNFSVKRMTVKLECFYKKL